MLEFMLKVFASNLFWVGYTILSGMVVVIIMRRESPHILARLTKDGKTADMALEKYNQQPDIDSEESTKTLGGAVLVAIFMMVLWPLYITFYAIVYSFKMLFKVIGILAKLFFTGLDKITPDFDIKVEVNKSEEE